MGSTVSKLIRRSRLKPIFSCMAPRPGPLMDFAVCSMRLLMKAPAQRASCERKLTEEARILMTSDSTNRKMPMKNST